MPRKSQEEDSGVTFCIVQNYFQWSSPPLNHKTKKQWLKLHRRLKKDADPVGTIHLVFDKARSCPKGVEPVPSEECACIRKKLATFGIDPSDEWDLYRLDRAGQLAVPYLYDIKDTEEITAFTEQEAEKLLEYLIWDHSHEDHFITETTENGERKRATWKSEYSMPSMGAHCAGDRYFGTKKGQMTRQITVDLDRHSGAVSGDDHILKTLKAGEILNATFPQYRFAPEVNPKNGSVKFFGWLPEDMPIPFAVKIAEGVRAVLQEQMPQNDFSKLEIFPSSCPQIFAPLRADKLTVIGTGVVAKVARKGYEQVDGKRVYTPYEAVSCADYLNWVCFSDTPYDSGTFEKHLRASVGNLPDGAAQAKPDKKAKSPDRKPHKATSGGMGSIGRLKGCCAPTLVGFWSGEIRPEDDTIGKYVIVTLRLLKYEGLDEDEGVEWVDERLQNLKFTEFSDRLTNNPAELMRNVAAAARPSGQEMVTKPAQLSVSKRWCSPSLKIDVASIAINNEPRFKNARILFLTGERRQESAARSKYAEMEQHRTHTKSRHVDHWRMVIDWTEEEVWNIMREVNVMPHPAYRLGWGRVSCLACIFGVSDQWASVRVIAPDLFNRIAEYERDFGKTIHKGKSVVDLADRGTPYPDCINPELVGLAMGREYPAHLAFD